MNIQSFTFNPFGENTYILYDKSRECIIIDPGCYQEDEEKKLENFITKKNLNPIKLINTHCHIDHVLGNQFIKERWGIDLAIHHLDFPLLENVGEIAEIYGFKNYKKSPAPKEFLKEGDLIVFGETKLKVLFAPGHSPGHICLYNSHNNILISGDVIFKNSIGRTDLPGGDYETLINSIKNNIIRLPDKTQIFCGHGPTTNIKAEKENNPFIQ